MRRFLLPALAPLLAFSSASAHTAPAVTPEAMMRHIEVLASDAFEGRKPGTAGETKTLQYLAAQFAALGLLPAAGEGRWFQPVPLVERRPFAHRASWTVGGAPVELGADGLVLVGKDPVERVAAAPVWFVGHASPEQIAGADLKGAIALMLYQAPAGAPSAAERALALHRAGAAAVITVFPDTVPWTAIQTTYGQGTTRLRSTDVPDVQGAMLLSNASRLSGQPLAGRADQPGFRAVRTPASGTLDVSTRVWLYDSHNVIGRLRGKGAAGESILYLAHWDHLGICAPEGAADRICNGAVDNASGLAMMIEIARRLSRGERPSRDILFMGTTAEEMGLLGAKYFGEKPPVPLESIVAAINIDTVAIAGRGEPVAIVGRGTTPLDPLVDATARELGRAVETGEDANAFVQRQDGWELIKAGIPTVMVGGSFANMAKLQAFLGGPYHQPEDDLKRPIELGGAAEDTDLLIALGRKLADPRQYRPERR